MRSIHTPVVDKLDPSVSFSGQMRRAAGEMDAEDPMNFRGISESLIKAKKDKMNFVREAQKQLAV